MTENPKANNLDRSFSDFSLNHKNKIKQLATLLITKLNTKLKRVQLKINEAIE